MARVITRFCDQSGAPRSHSIAQRRNHGGWNNTKTDETDARWTTPSAMHHYQLQFAVNDRDNSDEVLTTRISDPTLEAASLSPMLAVTTPITN